MLSPARSTIETSEASDSLQMSRPLTRSPATVVKITVKNRRKRYLETHPEYFESPFLELTGLHSTENYVRLGHVG